MVLAAAAHICLLLADGSLLPPYILLTCLLLSVSLLSPIPRSLAIVAIIIACFNNKFERAQRRRERDRVSE